MKSMRVRIFAALVVAAFPACANADTFSVPVTWPDAAFFAFGNPVNSDPFAQFHPALGTLTNITLTVTGIGVSVGNLPDLFFVENHFGNTFFEIKPSGNLFFISQSGSINLPDVLADFTGAGQERIGVENSVMASIAFFSFPPSSFVTYEFTPVAQTPLPTALPLFATGLGVLGLLGWRKRKSAAASAA